MVLERTPDEDFLNRVSEDRAGAPRYCPLKVDMWPLKLLAWAVESPNPYLAQVSPTPVAVPLPRHSGGTRPHYHPLPLRLTPTGIGHPP